MPPRSFEIEIDPATPFLNDQLNRTGSVNFLADHIKHTNGPYVLAIDGSWGEGKTTFVRLLKTILENADYHCVYFNAWKYDYVSDPLIALVSVLEDLKPSDPRLATAFMGQMKTVGKLAGHLAKRGATLGIKAFTGGLVDARTEGQIYLADVVETPEINAIEDFQKQQDYLKLFREALESAVDKIDDSEVSKPVIFFIDELDRCRPDFSLTLLERIKHLFDVKNIVFVLSIDKSQLNISTTTVYGTGINSQEYLRRFFDIEFRIPKPSKLTYIKYLLAKSGMDSAFDLRIGSFGVDKDDFTKSFLELSEIFGLTLRAIESCMLRMKVVMDQTSSNQTLDPFLASLLIILRETMPERFQSICSGDEAPEATMAFIREKSGGAEFCDSHDGKILEAYLIAYDVNVERCNSAKRQLRTDIENPAESDWGRSLLTKKLALVDSIGHARNGGITLKYLASKIDLAAQIS